MPLGLAGALAPQDDRSGGDQDGEEHHDSKGRVVRD